MCLIDKLEKFVRRLRWKIFHYENPNSSTHKETYGFKSTNSPPTNRLLLPFENDLYHMIQNIKFSDPRHVPAFQKQLSKDAKNIKNSTDLYVPADKTTNLYKVSKENYQKLLHDNITKTYKKTEVETINTINMEARDIAKDQDLDERIESFSSRGAFITLKDHKENFQNDPKCRLINPAKSEIGKISKKLIERINREILEKTEVQQWRSTEDVLKWFTNIPQKSRCKFMKFDIVEFYPSISENLLLSALQFAANLNICITEEELAIIRHSRKSLLFNNSQPWVKKGISRHELFDVTMGSWDGAEVCELVGLFILSQIKGAFGINNVGLYRDDGLALLKDYSGPQADRLRKALEVKFKQLGLRITVETNLKVTDFLDVTLDLNSGKFCPYRKPNDVPLYIHKESNHPATIIKELPKMIEKKLCDRSYSEEEFTAAKPLYQQALSASGYSEDIQFSKPENRRKKNRPRKNIIWFNPPFSMNVKTDIRKQFSEIIARRFPPNHKYRKLINQHNVKLSYSCMDNMKDIIRKHNSKILSPAPESNQPTCNCRTPTSCPLDGNCLATDIVYKATVESKNSENSSTSTVKHYIGLATNFKERYANHMMTFRQRKYSNSDLSSHIWMLKDRGKPYTISWSIVTRASAYPGGSRRCNLCVAEKLAILQADQRTLLNTRDEIVNKCRHKNKFYLRNLRFV